MNLVYDWPLGCGHTGPHPVVYEGPDGWVCCCGTCGLSFTYPAGGA